jgi:hypothetical protein
MCQIMDCRMPQENDNFGLLPVSTNSRNWSIVNWMMPCHTHFNHSASDKDLAHTKDNCRYRTGYLYNQQNDIELPFKKRRRYWTGYWTVESWWEQLCIVRACGDKLIGQIYPENKNEFGNQHIPNKHCACLFCYSSLRVWTLPMGNGHHILQFGGNYLPQNPYHLCACLWIKEK